MSIFEDEPGTEKFYVIQGYLVSKRVPIGKLAGYHWPLWMMWVEEKDRPWPWFRWKLIDEADWWRDKPICWPIYAKPSPWVEEEN